jgi:putative transposase
LFRFFAFAPKILRMIYSTNAVEVLNCSLRKIIKTRGSFPNDGETVKQSIPGIDCRPNVLKL